MKAIVQLFLALVLVVGFMPLYPTAASAEAERAAMAEADGTSTAGTDGESATEDSCSTYELVAQAEADGDCAPGQALVVYHASGAAKGSTGALTIQSEDDPLADSGFMAADTWDLSAADDVAEENGAATDGALTVQSEDTGSAIASGSDVRVALVERDDMSVADLVASLEALDFVECAQPNYVIMSSDDEAAAESLASAFSSTDTTIDTASVAGAAASAATGASTSATTLSASSYGPLSLPAGITTDTFSSLQWALSGPDSVIGGSTAGVDVSAAYKAEASGTTDNVVAIIDDSLDYTNPDLAAAVWTNPGNLGIGPAGSHGFNGATGAYDPMPSSEIHGTHCAGIAAATTGNALGIASPSGNGTHTKVMGLRYENDAGYGFYSGITGCYEYLVKARLAGVKIPVVSCSWGSSDGASYIPVLDYLINQAGKAGVLSFFASGNEARDAYNYHDSTAIESPYCIQIASSDETGSLSHFTTYQETGVDIAAPGSAILSTISAATSENFKALLTHMSGDYDAQTNPNGRADRCGL